MNCDLLDLSGLLSIEETRKQTFVITSAPPSNTAADYVSNTPTQPPPTGRSAPHPTQPPAQTSAMDYPQPRGVPCKCIAAMMHKDKSCLGCHFNKPDDSPRLKFRQEAGCPVLAKHGYIFRKDVTASATIVYQFNTKFPRMTYQARAKNPVAKRISYDSSSDHVFYRRLHPPTFQTQQ